MPHIDDLPVQDAVSGVIHDIQRIREARGVSKYRLAKLTGLHASTIGLIERGARSPSLFVMLKISEALGVSLGCILSEHESSGPGDDESPGPEMVAGSPPQDASPTIPL